MPNGIHWIKNAGERQFAKWLEAHNRPFIHHPHSIRLGMDKYKPDFLLTDTDEYVEVAATRQAFSYDRKKIEDARALGFKILVVKPDGTPYRTYRRRVEITTRELRPSKRWANAPDGSLRFLRQLLGLRQYEAARLLGLPNPTEYGFLEKVDEGLFRFKDYSQNRKLSRKQRMEEDIKMAKKKFFRWLEQPILLPQFIQKRKAAACP